MDEIIGVVDQFAAFGLEGLVIAILFILVFVMLALNWSSNKEWRSTITEYSKEHNEAQKENNIVLRELSTVIGEFKGILKNRK